MRCIVRALRPAVRNCGLHLRKPPAAVYCSPTGAWQTGARNLQLPGSRFVLTRVPFYRMKVKFRHFVALSRGTMLREKVPSISGRLWLLLFIALILGGCGSMSRPTPTTASYPTPSPTPSFPTFLSPLPSYHSPLLPPTPTPSLTPGMWKTPPVLPAPLPILVSPLPAPTLWPTPPLLPADAVAQALTPPPTPLPKPPRAPKRLQDDYFHLVTYLVNRFYGDLDAVQNAYLT